MEGFISSLILLSIWLISTLLLRAAIKILRPGLHHPPTPFALPIIGHLHLLGTLPHQSLHALSQRYGPIIRLHFGSSPCIVASTPDAARAFLKTNDLAFSSRPSSAAIRTLNYGECTFIFAKYGPYWKFMKKLCMSELLNGRLLDNFGPVRHEERVSMIKCLLEKSEANEEVDLRGELMKLSYNVITRMMMSRRGTDAGGGDISDVREIVEESERITGMFNLEDFVWFCKGLKKEAKDVHERFDRIIEGVLKEKEMERREGKGRERMKDLFDVLMDVSEDENAEVKLTRDDIKGFSMEVYVAGTDTSSITIEWALAELINHPSVLSKARAEIESIIGKTRLVEETDIPNLPYLQSIVKETFRLHPPAPFILREATKDCVVSGYDIPNKTRLIVNAWSVGRDPEYWEEPMEFRPERFMEEKCAGVDVRGQHFELLPFGSGRRGCPGASLGLHVVHTTLASLVQCFELRVEDAVVDMKEGSSFNNPREKPLVCVPVARFNPFVTVG